MKLCEVLFNTEGGITYNTKPLEVTCDNRGHQPMSHVTSRGYPRLEVGFTAASLLIVRWLTLICMVSLMTCSSYLVVSSKQYKPGISNFSQLKIALLKFPATFPTI